MLNTYAMNPGKVLIVDDEPNALRVLSAILSEEGYRVCESNGAEKAIRIIDREDVDAIITDIRMPSMDGMQFFEYVKEQRCDVPVIFLTAFGSVDSAVSAMNRGAFYYFIKPPDYPKLKGILARAVEQRFLKRELVSLKKKLYDEKREWRLIGNSPGMRRIFEIMEAVKDSPSSVMIHGETGTGKELIARAVHQISKRSNSPFVAVNCAAIPKNLIESELFGYEKGAFTGAISRRVGKFEEAGEGVLFLDEIGELGLSLQAKLLRVLQEREIERLGSNKKIRVESRLMSSTNRDLRREVQEGNFREDLFYRINVIEMKAPPLRERMDDIPLLVSGFVGEFCTRENKNLTVSNEVMRVFQNYSWPGNVRQLKNVIERAVVLSRGDKVTLRELPEDFFSLRRHGTIVSSVQTFRELELQAIRDSLRVSNGNKSKAAKALGISRKALYKRLRENELI